MPTSRGLVPFPPPRRHGRIALLPCPFEHDEPSPKLTILHISDANGRGFAVGCECGAQGPMAYEAGRYAPGSRREARARTQARRYWNDRAIPK